MTQLVGGKSIPPDVLARDASAAYPFGLHNTAETITSFVAQRLRPLPTDSEFVRMADYIMDLIHDLLESGLETFSDSNSSGGSHHSSLECFIAKTSDGHVLSASNSSETPRDFPCVRMQEGRGSRL
jgi:hypothetical protein